MKHWLWERLTPYKQEEQRWADLAVAIEEFWDTHHQPHLQRIADLRSVFDAHRDDVSRMMTEAGIQFEVGIPLVESNRAFAFAWRAYEIHHKDHAETLTQVLSRDFSGAEVRWEPLMAPRGQPYGEGYMMTEHEIDLLGLDSDDYHRTYRGVITANLTGVLAVLGNKAEFERVTNKKVQSLRPAHIVHDGNRFYQMTRSDLGPDVSFNGRHHEFSSTLLVGAGQQKAFDYMPLDEVALDEDPLQHALISD